MKKAPLPFSVSSILRSGVLISTIRKAQEKSPPSRARIVQLSDLHFGPATSKQHLVKIVKMALDLNPDCVAITGDFIQATRASFITYAYAKINRGPFTWLAYRRMVQKLVRELNEIIKPLADHAPIFAVPGNHDLEEGIGTIRRCLPETIRWITNDAAVCNVNGVNLAFAGVDDFMLGKPLLPQKLPPTFGEASLKVLLTHNPDFLMKQQPVLLKAYDLALAGHTHGGQICLPRLGPIISRTKYRDHNHGLSHHSAVPLYVSRGVGFGAIPVRLNCPPEIVVVEI